MENLKPRKKPGRKPLKKPIELDPTEKDLIASGLTVAEADYPVDDPGTKAFADLKKKYPIAHKWPSLKFFKCIVSRSDSTLKEYPTAQEQPPNVQYFHRVGVGSPVHVFLDREVILPEEIINAVRDTAVQYPVVLGNKIDEKSNGFNHYETRARFRATIVAPATPEEYEGNVMIGRNRETA